MVCVLKACSTEGFIGFHGTSSLLDLSPRFAYTQIIPTPIGNIFIDDSAFPFHLMSNNIALLTQSHKAIAAKKKARREQIKEIKFDDEARRLVFDLYPFLSSFLS